MPRPNEYVLDAANAEPVKTLSKRTHDFIVTGAGEQMSFLPPMPFAPSMPPVGSAAETALHDLLARDWTQIDWLTEGKGWRLSAAVKSLDYLGWQVQSNMVQHPGWPNAIARYSLSQKAKQAAALRQQGGTQ